jgi:hypothetical protein
VEVCKAGVVACPKTSAAFFFGFGTKEQGGVDAFLHAERVHKGRRPGVRVVAMNLDPEALAILRAYCPEGNKQLGEFIARLLIDRRARDEERARLRTDVLSALS